MATFRTLAPASLTLIPQAPRDVRGARPTVCQPWGLVLRKCLRPSFPRTREPSVFKKPPCGGLKVAGSPPARG
ncbi:hypothetical protein CBM2634_A10118 [Cupriavidus taiwanensis]|uniref:Uncharacterized protein n=1 Tax=Cupriavidus taiwanensis TaxID=164546 RepID=A0A375ITJ8_9BURK|nr:hypothetical protein CBM2634_A10118 [Cupriavidus taiwanensis]